MRTLSLPLILFLIIPLTVPQAKAGQSKDTQGKDAPKNAQQSSDDRIHDEVMAKLANDSDVRGGGFEVIVKNGAVTIRGQVHTDKAKEKAEKIVKKVKGVVSVDNQLKLFE